MDNPNDIVHSLYNSLAAEKNPNLADIEEVLLKVYKRIDSFDSLSKHKIVPLINRLVNYIYFTGYTEKIHFSPDEENLLRKLSAIGKYAGLTGTYGSNYRDKSQF